MSPLVLMSCVRGVFRFWRNTFSFFFKKIFIYLFIERGREGEREKHRPIYCLSQG